VDFVEELLKVEVEDSESESEFGGLLGDITASELNCTSESASEAYVESHIELGLTDQSSESDLEIGEDIEKYLDCNSASSSDEKLYSNSEISDDFQCEYFYSGQSTDQLAGTLYDNAPLSVSASWQAIMHFSLSNHLSYNAINQLLDLMKIHLPSEAMLPKNVPSLKRMFVKTVPTQYLYCSECYNQIEGAFCNNSNCKEKAAAVCYFVPVSIVNISSISSS